MKQINATIPSVFETEYKANFPSTVSSDDAKSCLRMLQRRKQKFKYHLEYGEHFPLAWISFFFNNRQKQTQFGIFGLTKKLLLYVDKAQGEYINLSRLIKRIVGLFETRERHVASKCHFKMYQAYF